MIVERRVEECNNCTGNDYLYQAFRYKNDEKDEKRSIIACKNCRSVENRFGRNVKNRLALNVVEIHDIFDISGLTLIIRR